MRRGAIAASPRRPGWALRSGESASSGRSQWRVRVPPQKRFLISLLLLFDIWIDWLSSSVSHAFHRGN